jgi:hypothetical protein
MRSIVTSIIILGLAFAARAQKVDSICFHLYTDSLKKGTHNYINVDGKLSDGSWRPMTSRDIEFTASACSFSNNDLVIPADCKEEKITIRAVLRSNPAMKIEKTVWIKRRPDPDLLPGRDDTQSGPGRNRGKHR